MPYKLVPFPAPKNENLFVFKELPPGFSESKSIFYEYRKAFRDKESLYHCEFCDGWIVGSANAFYENTLNQNMIGRRGTAYYCRRCGKEIAFQTPRFEWDWREKRDDGEYNFF